MKIVAKNTNQTRTYFFQKKSPHHKTHFSILAIVLLYFYFLCRIYSIITHPKITIEAEDEFDGQIKPSPFIRFWRLV
jgi:Ni,Fe-hydrogenase I cytochrome b subunit